MNPEPTRDETLEEMAREGDDPETLISQLQREISSVASAPAIVLERPIRPASGADDHLEALDPVSRNLQLLRQNVDLLLIRNEQQGKLLETAAVRMDATRTELTETMALWHQQIAEMDDRVHKLGVALHALIRLYQRMKNKE